MSNSFVLRGGTLIDGTGNVLENSEILVENGMILKVEKAYEANSYSDYKVIDVSNKTIMPGLIDAHLHIDGRKSLNRALSVMEPIEMQMGRALNDLTKLIDAGFTTVRDAGSPVALSIKRLIDEGEYKGPEIKTPHLILSQTGGHGDIHTLPTEFNKWRICDGVDDCRKAAREQIREGADFIKICSTGGILSERDNPSYTQFTLDEIKAIVYEAEAVGSYVASHAQGSLGIINALKAGVKTIEHGTYINDKGIEMMLDQSAYLIPTLAIKDRIVKEGNKFGVPDFGINKAKQVHDQHIQNIRRAYQAGVKIALGTDFLGCDPVDHGENALELELLVNKIGMSNMEAIVAGTSIAAEAMGIAEEVGTIETGKKANIIIVNGNPLKNINILKKTECIEKVFIEGNLVKNTQN